MFSKLSNNTIPVQVPSLRVILCAQKISKKTYRHQITHKKHSPVLVLTLIFFFFKKPHILHKVLVRIVCQNAGDVPVSWGQRLEDVCANVRLMRNNTEQHDKHKISWKFSFSAATTSQSKTIAGACNLHNQRRRKKTFIIILPAFTSYYNFTSAAKHLNHSGDWRSEATEA